MNENIVSVNCVETQNIEVYWQDEVVLNLDVELMYVKSGQTEIKEYTDKEILPELKNYKKQAQNAMEKAENSANAAAQSEAEVAQNCIKVRIDTETAEKAAAAAAENAAAVSVDAHIVKQSAAAAVESAQNAAESAKSAAESAEIFDDERLLHRFGDEIKSGVLGVSGLSVQNSDSDSAVIQKNLQFSFADKIETAHSRSYVMSDKNDRVCGQIKNVVNPDKSSHLLLSANSYAADGTKNTAELGVHITADGQTYVTVPTPVAGKPTEALNLEYADANYAKLTSVNVFNANTFNNRSIYKEDKYAVRESPNEHIFTGFRSLDKNDTEYGSIYTDVTPEGAIKSSLYVCNADNKCGDMGVYIDKSGNVMTTAPACECINSIVTTLLKASGCCKFGNRLLFQWGLDGVTNGSKILFKQPYADTSYVVLTQVTAMTGNLVGAVSVFCDTILKTTTGFSVAVSSNVALEWVAIGYV